MDRELADPSAADKNSDVSLVLESSDSNSNPISVVPSPIQNASKSSQSSPKIDSTFIQQQLSIQRSPSAAKDHVAALSRQLSTKSNGTPDVNGIKHPSTPAINSPLSLGSEEVINGRARCDSDSSIIDATNSCTLSKSSSERSTRSVREMYTVGSYPLGSLRVHSPSPTRASKVQAFGGLKSGDVVIVRGVPASSLLGYDTRAFTIRDKDSFEGIKDMPAGAHFVWGGSGTGSLRNGFWFMSAKRASDELGEVHVRRWDNYAELLDEEVTLAEMRIQKDSVAEIFEKLQSYDITASNSVAAASSMKSSSAHTSKPTVWHNLTSSMKGVLLTKITGHAWNHWQVASTHDCKPSSPSYASVDEKLDFSNDEVLNFVFPKTVRTFSHTAIGRDRTDQAMDTSVHVMNVITNICSYEDSDEIIGEMQFCYITGMILGNVACMEQWANIVKVTFKAFRLALDLPKFFLKFIEAVHAQFIYDQEGVEGSILDHDQTLSDDLQMILTIFKSRLNEQLLAQGANLTPDQNEVGKAFEELESWLWKWNWDLRGNYVRSGKIQLEDGEFVDAELKDFEAEDERGEYAPAVVELDQEGHEIGLIRL